MVQTMVSKVNYFLVGLGIWIGDGHPTCAEIYW